jgi:hypothetical protein
LAFSVHYSQRGKEQGREQRGNGDDHQEFNQPEAFGAFSH